MQQCARQCSWLCCLVALWHAAGRDTLLASVPSTTLRCYGLMSYPQVVAGQALQSLCRANRGDGGGCLSLTAWILIFSASQLLLCLLPDINSLMAVTALGAATTLGFSVLATVGSALQGGWAGGWGMRDILCTSTLRLIQREMRWPMPMAAVAPSTLHAPRHAGRAPDVSYAVQGSAADRVFGAFTSLGAVYLLFGLTVLLDIQVGATALPESHSAVLGQAMCWRHLPCQERL